VRYAFSPVANFDLGLHDPKVIAMIGNYADYVH